MPMEIPDNEILERTRNFGKLITKSHNFLENHGATRQGATQKEALAHCLRRSLDLCKGAVATAIGCTPVSMATITRTLLEELIAVQWLCQDVANVAKHQENSGASALKLLRENLKRGYGAVIDKVSGEDRTQMVLGRIPSGSKVLSIEQKAMNCGLHRVYSILYRAQSHSSRLRFPAGSPS